MSEQWESSVLRCNVKAPTESYGCRFVHGDRTFEVMMGVIEVLDAKLAAAEEAEIELSLALGLQRDQEGT